MFQLMFAIITPGLVVRRHIAERMRFLAYAYVLFTILFSLCVCATGTLELASGRISWLKWEHWILRAVPLYRHISAGRARHWQGH